MQLLTILLSIFIVFILSLPLQAASTNLTPDRAKFLAAKVALQKGDEQRFTELLQQLTHYPLYPYLVSADLEKRLPSASNEEMHQFFDHYAATLVGSRLQTKWLLYLASQKRWEDFLEFYPSFAKTNPLVNTSLSPSDNAIQCLFFKAKSELGEQTLSYQALSPLWMQGKTESYSCENLFSAAIANGLIDANQVWAREQLAVDHNNISLVEKLRPYLSEEKQSWIDQWLHMMTNPLWITQAQNTISDDEEGRILIIDGIERYADKNPEAALQIWQQVRSHFHFTHEEHQRASHAIAMALATSGHPAAGKWLASVDDDWTDPLFREWRIRTTIMEQDWKSVLYWIEHLPPSEKNQSIWRYWNARALEKLNRKSAAQVLYRSLSQRYDYYGALARSQLPSPSPLELSIKLKASQNNDKTTTAIPMGVIRARELFFLQLIPDARREWQYAINTMSDKQLIQAAQLATQWGWYDQAIAAANKITQSSVLPLRYPLAYQQAVKTTAKQLGLNPAWVYAVMHQESNFYSDAKSSAGALGLMQLLPRTAYAIASRLNLRYQINNTSSLLNINTNILCGSNYLDELLKRFHGNMVLATTAYNAGPGQVQKWLNNSNHSITDADIWVETIPWRETRNYVKNIIFAMAVYETELRQPSSLAQVLQPVSLAQLNNTPDRITEIPEMLANGHNDESQNEEETIRIGENYDSNNSLAKNNFSDEEAIL